MDKNNNILVFPCGSEIGLEIHKSLKDVKNITLFGASSTSDHGEYVYKNYIPDIPAIYEENFLTKINEAIIQNKIDYIMAAHDSAVIHFAVNRNNLSCEFIGPSAEVAIDCRSKKRTYEKFCNIVRTPKIYNIDTVEKFPIFLKPDVGQGSKGCFVAKDIEDIKFYTKKDSSLLILEHLPGDEYTVDCFTNMHGDLLFIGPRKRERILNGISARTSTMDLTPEIETIARKINDNMKMNGMWFFQVKRDQKGELCLLEIAPRLAGTMGLYRNTGINFALLSLLNHQGHEIKLIKNNFSMTLDRCFHNSFRHNIQYENVYIDLDDTLIIKNKVNLTLIQFLYQCVNKGINLHLITRHKNSIEETLEKFKINKSLFVSIFHLKNNEKKSSFITNKNSIFIDDSFAERSDVSINAGIPCFDVDSIESLLEK